MFSSFLPLIGGVSDNIVINDDNAASDLFLVGAIKDIVITDKVLFLDTKDKNYHRADIGRAYLAEGEQKRPVRGRGGMEAKRERRT